MQTEMMVVAIVTVVMTAAVINRYLKTRQIEAQNTGGKEVKDKLARLDRLEERVKILEKIITNKKVNLADEIENL